MQVELVFRQLENDLNRFDVYVNKWRIGFIRYDREFQWLFEITTNDVYGDRQLKSLEVCCQLIQNTVLETLHLHFGNDVSLCASFELLGFFTQLLQNGQLSINS
ncbi:MAG: hypothetical protein LBP59_10840 [Planctomycetaceae bacterium]|nr:hypothetical protein [Planctomycetaceae bacterium]